MTEVSCIDLKEEFGDRFKIAWEMPGTSKWKDAWYQRIPCKHGHIYPHGDNELGFASNKRGSAANRFAALPFTTVTQDGDDGMNITFDVKHFDEVAKIIKPRKRRRLSAEHKARLRAAGRQNQFEKASQESAEKHGSGVAYRAPEQPQAEAGKVHKVKI